MARPAKGSECLSECISQLSTCKTAQEMRIALAVVLPLQFNMSLKDTAEAIGRSVTATCNMRTKYIQERSEGTHVRSKPVKRNRAKTTLDREAEILDAVLNDAAHGGVVVVPPLKPKVEALLGKTISLATLYNMLARHGWRKVAPDKIHPKGDPEAQLQWKKNCQKRSMR
jgi:Winged helix-turn helix